MAGVLTALGIIVVAALAAWGLPQLFKQHPRPSTTKIISKTTPTVSAPIGPTCSVASTVPSVYQAAVTAGPTNPPQISDAPANNSNGLQCLDILVGTGKLATIGSNVSVQYTGWLASNGKKFDSSYDNGGTPFSVTPLGQASVIPGWNVGLVGMKVGGIRRLIIPAALAYGPQGSPPTIPANATLIFDITVLSVS